MGAASRAERSVDPVSFLQGIVCQGEEPCKHVGEAKKTTTSGLITPWKKLLDGLKDTVKLPVRLGFIFPKYSLASSGVLI